VPLRLDVSGFQNTPLRKFELDRFNISAKIATAEEIEEFKKRDRVGRWISKLNDAVRPYYKRRLVDESTFHVDPKMFLVGPHVYLDGYWQSEKYFKDIEEVIRREFTFKSDPEAWNKVVAQSILCTNAVSLHVRRGDYVSNPLTSEVHGTCSIEYYRHAVDLIAEQCYQPHFYIFSDDQEWVKSNLVFSFPTTYIDKNSGESSFEDLRLMSLCKHNVIANSSFSWWGAWLNSNPGKIVVGPKSWFRKQNIDTRDLIPEDWVRI
jgi:hypothetical protein